ncbi:S8 family serine peptidase [Tahibacter amnicola]|uniref:S8 family serine peptidase n=1 Tax=Tahibacter amnicola TaxID=2976241 RepID=A0ABY6BJW2_9GAMM|nr:S8 family serine peptidase [Tahibacter amnicola]UXI70155.1 S8 family serine peptidase [Tahibacter amnicola]
MKAVPAVKATGLARHALWAALFASAAASAADVNPSLLASENAGKTQDVLLVMDDQKTPLTTPLAEEADYLVRRRALVANLIARADVSQESVRAWLDARGIQYRAYWIANVIQAELPASALRELAAQPSRKSPLRRVARVEPNPVLKTSLPKETSATESVEAIASGVNRIRAPSVWSAGFRGQGVVIGGMDTGYQWNHPALKRQYRGWNGTTANHNYHWHDAIHNASGNTCGNNAPAPCDDNGHGTHTAGTFAGDDGGSNQIGVAPGAKWIGCRNMAAGNGTPARYIECLQWMLAPTNLANQNPDPDLAPDVTSNSWGCVRSEGCTTGNEIRSAVDNLVAGGVMVVAAAGNDGSSCSTIKDPPAVYSSAFVVGATGTTNDSLANFSSRGPVSGQSAIKPDLSAPGVSVRSSVRNSSYGTMSGTSMATPHVAGVVALMMSAKPALKGNPAKVAQLLRQSVVSASVPFSQTCGGTTSGTRPNHMVGHGRLDAWLAYQAAINSP